MKLPFRKIRSCFTICMVEVEWGATIFLHELKYNGLLHFVLVTQTSRLAAEVVQRFSWKCLQSCIELLLIFLSWHMSFLCYNTVRNGACCLKYFKVILNCCPVSNWHIKKFSSEFITAFLVWILFLTCVLYENARCSNVIRITTVYDS